MTDRPILFSAPMVRALLAGTKTQTRRTLNPQPNMLNGALPLNNGRGSYSTEGGWKRYPIAAGDRLWVKETWQGGSTGDGPAIAYLADNSRWYPSFTGPSEGRGPTFDYDAFPTTAWRKGFWLADVEEHGPWASPLHMSRWMSRLTLHVTDVRVQRLQDISDADALDEGISGGVPGQDIDIDGQWWAGAPVKLYRDLWNSINGAGSWDKNPWVAAYTFTVERANIDQARAA